MKKSLEKIIVDQADYIEKVEDQLIIERKKNIELKAQLKKVYGIILTILEDAKKSKLKEIIKLVEEK